MRRAWAVVDLGFGDAGKGLVVDALARETGATLVVRTSGGAQASHNVVTPDGRHHAFAQLGAASFLPGVRTLLTGGMIVHPTALPYEAAALAAAGVPDALDRLQVDAGCALITPFDQAVGRLRELARGAHRHGSCGVGVGEVAASVAAGEPVARAADLRAPGRLREAAERRRERALREVAELVLPANAAVAAETALLADPRVGAAWVGAAAVLAPRVVDEAGVAAAVAAAEGTVFEGAQGVLLDGRVGFHPHTSWTDTTGAAETAFLARYAPGCPLTRVGVLRAFPTRHGPGPFPTETELPAWAEHNTSGPWQGGVRRGWFDAVLGRYALAAVGGVDALVLTWLDAVGPTPWRACDAYTTAAGRVHDLPAPGDLAAQAALGALLAAARPELEAPLTDAAAVVAAVERLLGRPVTHTAAGPTATTFRRGS